MHSSKLDWQDVEMNSCRYGIMAYSKNDLIIGRSLREYGEWAQAELDLLFKFLNPGCTVIDIGAYIGTHTLAFAKAVGISGEVYAFEPNPLSFELLNCNIKQNTVCNVKLFNIALSDLSKAIFIPESELTPEGNLASFSLCSKVLTNSDEKNTNIHFSTLDNYSIEKCDLIKIDVEGMELNVLKGGCETIKRLNPLIFAECLSIHNGWQVISFMKDMEYEAFLHNELAFNPLNFRNNPNNFFGDARETNLILVSKYRLASFLNQSTYLGKIIPINNIDDLALGLLKKPQYKYEVLAKTKAAQILGSEFIANEPELKRLTDKSIRIEQLEPNIQNINSNINIINSEIRELNNARKARDSKIEILEESLNFWNIKISELPKFLQAKDSQINDLYSELKKQIVQINELNKALQTKDSNIENLQKELTEQTEQISELTATLQEEDLLNKGLESKLGDKNKQISEISNSLQEVNNQIFGLQGQLRDIQTGIPMQLKNKYQGIIEKLLCQGTRRRRLYQISLTGIRIIMNEGWHAFLRKAKLKFSKKHISYLQVSDRSVHIGITPLNRRQQVDIVIPVYNAFDWTRRCLSAVISFTVGLPYKIIIVNDASTDPRLSEYLNYLQAKHDNVIVLHNSKNLGFLKTANKGMEFSHNDVVLLNSDAFVTYNWLGKLQDCAYSDELIATVTPLSNNATICSVPEFCQDNQIPPGYSIHEFGQLVERSSKNLGVFTYELPVGIGFCMYIKRKIISEIGLLSEEFGRGYEEEVDFCLRASQKGYRHVACPHVFVYHAGTTSTNKEQAKLLETKNWNTLVKRHPHYPKMVSDFATRNPLSDIQIAIRKNIEMRTDKYLNIGLDAQLLTRERWTGTERLIMGQIDGLVKLDRNNRYTVFTANNDLDRYYDQNNKFLRKYASDSIDILWDVDYSTLDVFHRTFQCYSAFDLLLLVNSKASVISILDLISFHHPDYFIDNQAHKRYQKIIGLSAKVADRIIAISEHSKQDIAINLNVDSNKIDVIYPAILNTDKFKKIEDPRAILDFKAKHNINNPYILYIGTTFPHKNHEGLIEAYEYYLNNLGGSLNSAPDLILIGPDTHLNRRKIIESKLTNIKNKVKFLDFVSDEDMPLFYSCAALFVFPSLYEGFGLPLLEAMACKVPVVASNTTSIPEVTGDAAILVDCTQPKQLADAMHLALNDKILRNTLVEKGERRIRLFSKTDMIKKTLAVYQTAWQAHNDKSKLPDDIVNEIKQLAKEDNANIFIDDAKLKIS